MSEGISRRRLLGWTGAGAAVAGIGAASGYALGRSEPTAPAPGHDVVEFRGTHQAGIVTPSQDELYFTALDLTSTGRATVQRMLSQWTAAAERMTRGLETAENGALPLDRETAPADTGEALELPPSSLTVTIGFGSSFFDKLGITDRRPAELATDLPAFRGDRLDPSRTGGDICIQACANDPQVAVHAVRNLIRIGFGTIAVRWAQLGYGRTSSTSIQQPTARNLFGFKDGTNNLKAEEPDLLDEHVWVQKGDGPDWMTGGSYLIARRIRMHIETWDRAPLDEQEEIMGRTKGTGAPLGGTGEFEPANYRSIDANGTPVIPLTSHIRLASAESLNGIKILRRGFNFVAGADDRGHLNAGLFFICFVRNPQTQFVPMQQALAANDAMMEYIQHTGSAVFACPPGLREGEYWGQRLLEDSV